MKSTKHVSSGLMISVFVSAVLACTMSYADRGGVRHERGHTERHYHGGAYDREHRHGYGHDPDEYYDHNGYYNHGGYYNSGSLVAPGVIIGAPYGGYYTNPRACAVIQKCDRRGNCVQYQPCQ